MAQQDNNREWLEESHSVARSRKIRVLHGTGTQAQQANVNAPKSQSKRKPSAKVRTVKQAKHSKARRAKRSPDNPQQDSIPAFSLDPAILARCESATHNPDAYPVWTVYLAAKQVASDATDNGHDRARARALYREIEQAIGI